MPNDTAPIYYRVTTRERTDEERAMLVIGLQMVKGVFTVTPDRHDPTAFSVMATRRGIQQVQALLVIEGVAKVEEVTKPRKTKPKTGEWCWSEDEERYGSTFDTREAALDDARSQLFGELDRDSRVIFVAQVGQVADAVDAICSTLDHDWISENAEEYFYENFHNDDSLLDGIPLELWEDLQADLHRAVEAWGARTGVRDDLLMGPDWYIVEHKSVERLDLEPLPAPRGEDPRLTQARTKAGVDAPN